MTAPKIAARLNVRTQTSAPSAKRSITISEAVSIFLAAQSSVGCRRYDIDTANAEKLTGPTPSNPQLTVGLSELPVNLSGPFIKSRRIRTAFLEPSSWVENETSALMSLTQILNWPRDNLKWSCGN